MPATHDAGAPGAGRPAFGTRLAAAMAEHGPLCVGIDPHPGLLAAWGLPDDADGLRSFALRTVEAIAGQVAAVKPQVALFERHGSRGMAALEETLAAAPGEKRDTKSARDLSAILKDMTALERELNTAGERRGVTVRFEGGTEEAAE